MKREKESGGQVSFSCDEPYFQPSCPRDKVLIQHRVISHTKIYKTRQRGLDRYSVCLVSNQKAHEAVWFIRSRDQSPPLPPFSKNMPPWLSLVIAQDS